MRILQKNYTYLCQNNFSILTVSFDFLSSFSDRRGRRSLQTHSLICLFPQFLFSHRLTFIEPRDYRVIFVLQENSLTRLRRELPQEGALI